MGHFYGTVQGNSKPATRQGTKDSGIYAVAQSWNGSVRVDFDELGGETVCTISVQHGSSATHGRTLWSGPLVLLDESLGRFRLVSP